MKLLYHKTKYCVTLTPHLGRGGREWELGVTKGRYGTREWTREVGGGGSDGTSLGWGRGVGAGGSKGKYGTREWTRVVSGGGSDEASYGVGQGSGSLGK